MEYVIRIKVVSLCLGIRRSNVYYSTLNNKEIDLVKYRHPISIFKKIEIEDFNLKILNKEEVLTIGKEVYFYNVRNVKTLTGEEIEKATLGVMLIPVEEYVINNFKNAVLDDMLFDQWDGEYEYLLGLMEEILNKAEYQKWYDLAKEKQFYDKLI